MLQRPILTALPLLFFMALTVVFYLRQGGPPPATIPSALIDKPMPATSLPRLEGWSLEGVDTAVLHGQVSVVNIFASWCGPCVAEHPQLVELGKDSRIKLVGINYKDTAENAGTFLQRLGNPYALIGEDRLGRAGIEWGVYGVPETFIIDRDGRIKFKFVGPIMPQDLENIIRPELNKLLAVN